MYVRFWGTRGSIASPGPQTVRYGGNTSCVEARTASGTLLVFDCGTGLRGLGAALAEDSGAPRTVHLLVTHTHWDHIQGIPFFRPLFDPAWTCHVYGPRGIGTSLRETLAGQMQYAYFPIGPDQFQARVEFHELVEGHFAIEDVELITRYQNHPALTLGFRVEADDGVFVYATDHEPHDHRLGGAEGDGRPMEDQAHAWFLQGADLLVHDAQYTREEYPRHVGWGHSPVEFVVDEAVRAGVGALALYHHDPTRSDDALDAMVARMLARVADVDHPPQIFAAAEGDVFEVAPRRDGRNRTAVPVTGGTARQDPDLGTARPVVVALDDPEMASTLEQVARADHLDVKRVADPHHLLELAAESPSLVLLGRWFGGKDALSLTRAIRGATRRPCPVAVIARSDEVDQRGGLDAGVNEWLTLPFKPTYVRTRVQSLILRTRCRWSPAPMPNDEDRRITALRGLGILDTAEEERFDRYTRLAAAVFEVPVALVSLIDTERQWFKSHHGTPLRESPRSQAICAHAILRPGPLVINDTLRDDRFADNPLVSGPPRVRFYAGVPLTLDDGSRVGTLCLLDHRPRDITPERLTLLRDLGHLVEEELKRAAS